MVVPTRIAATRVVPIASLSDEDTWFKCYDSFVPRT